MVLKVLRPGLTVHGFGSACKDWASGQAAYLPTGCPKSRWRTRSGDKGGECLPPRRALFLRSGWQLDLIGRHIAGAEEAATGDRLDDVRLQFERELTEVCRRYKANEGLGSELFASFKVRDAMRIDPELLVHSCFYTGARRMNDASAAEDANS